MKVAIGKLVDRQVGKYVENRYTVCNFVCELKFVSFFFFFPAT